MPASVILMVRPAAFGFNDETAADNFFQTGMAGISPEAIQQKALFEFDHMVQLLRQQQIEVIVVEDTPDPPRPSAVFPNNWLSSSPEGILFMFPMCAPSRRKEKRDDIIEWLYRDFEVSAFQDWSEYEVEGRFLEGTGSMVMDHENKIIYACLSPRTSISLLEKFADRNGYHAITFLAKDINGQYLYHTNVMMCLGEKFAVLCQEAIEEEWERIAVRQLLESTGHEIITITLEQLHQFAGNMLELKNKEGKNILVLSQSAKDALSPYQLEELSQYATLLPIPVPVIEKTEGGSVRCMMAEIFLKRK
ncbi:MAG: amidinotransferase [Terrimonas sp.]|nr:amidinotransferase [Terrimonas sp.]